MEQRETADSAADGHRSFCDPVCCQSVPCNFTFSLSLDNLSVWAAALAAGAPRVFVRGTQLGWKSSRPSVRSLLRRMCLLRVATLLPSWPASSVCLSLNVRLVRVSLRTVYSRLAVSLCASIVVARGFSSSASSMLTVCPVVHAGLLLAISCRRGRRPSGNSR